MSQLLLVEKLGEEALDVRLVDVIGRPDFDAFIERVGDEFFVEVRRAYFLVPE